ncbi:MAG TPA: hypothetical protein QF353_01140 [Gammaproteobacteria bacterium]|nr:hypothetical protein [Gammaproteobacteria bacterium]
MPEEHAIHDLSDILSASRDKITQPHLLAETLTLILKRSKADHREIKSHLPENLKHVPYQKTNFFKEKHNQQTFLESAQKLFDMSKKLSDKILHNPIKKTLKKVKTSLLNILKELKRIIRCLHSLLKQLDESNLLIMQPNFYASIKIAVGALKLLDNILDWFTKNVAHSKQPQKQHN